jgi:hypothetical protein
MVYPGGDMAIRLYQGSFRVNGRSQYKKNYEVTDCLIAAVLTAKYNKYIIATCSIRNAASLG